MAHVPVGDVNLCFVDSKCHSTGPSLLKLHPNQDETLRGLSRAIPDIWAFMECYFLSSRHVGSFWLQTRIAVCGKGFTQLCPSNPSSILAELRSDKMGGENTTPPPPLPLLSFPPAVLLQLHSPALSHFLSISWQVQPHTPYCVHYSFPWTASCLYFLAPVAYGLDRALDRLLLAPGAYIWHP